MSSPYYAFSEYFKKQGFDGRVQKITVDAGFSCPNRDGKLSEEGCIYCDNRSFSPNTREGLTPIDEQIAKGINMFKARNSARHIIVYFQAYTNTYADLDRLKEVYDSIRAFPEVCGLAIATRPDCVTHEILALIHSYARDYNVWIEYGLQSIHDVTLDIINRGHTYKAFQDAVALTRQYEGINICAHCIIGLPGESEDMIVQTAQAVGELHLEGVKIHPLHVIKGTKLAQLYHAGMYSPLSFNDYCHLTVRFLESLWPQTVIQRLTADCPPELLLGPAWINEKARLITAIDTLCAAQNTFQGRLFSAVL